VKHSALAEHIGYLQNAMGTCAGPQDCFPVLRGIKTLAIRIEENNRNALAIACWLENHRKVRWVPHSGCQAILNTTCARAKPASAEPSPAASVLIATDYSACSKAYAFFILAESLGGVESLIDHLPR
jgi:cystathionine beta-lyase/cystathionine gamma-synthase